MQQTSKPVSRFKVFLLWAILIGNLFLWLGLWVWRHPNQPVPAPDEPQVPALFQTIFMLFAAAFFLAGGLGSYFLVIATNCFTLDFSRPVFSAYKGKLYAAKIIVPILVSVGVALILGVVLDPLLRSFGIQGQIAFAIPLLAAIVPIQIAQMWINVWAPIARKLITKRLAARGIQPSQMQGAILAGTSDPTRSSFKKLTLVEDDIGALWMTGDRLIYWGDTDQWAITREELVQLERRADTGSTSMLAGTAHVILHWQLSDGSVRQIRLHTEGHWTQGRNRKAMDELAEAVANWHAAAPTTAPAIAN